MPRNDENIKKSEDFIKKVLADNFGQSVDAEVLRKAAEKLCAAIPAAMPVAA